MPADSKITLEGLGAFKDELYTKQGEWKPNEEVEVGDVRFLPGRENAGYILECTEAGTTGETQPVIDKEEYNQTMDKGDFAITYKEIQDLKNDAEAAYEHIEGLDNYLYVGNTEPETDNVHVWLNPDEDDESSQELQDAINEARAWAEEEADAESSLIDGAKSSKQWAEEAQNASNAAVNAKDKIISEGFNFVFENVAMMKASTYLAEGMIAKTAGYWNYNDDGGALYYIRQAKDDGTEDETKPSAIHLINGLVAELIVDGYVTPEMFGAIGDGVTDDTVAIQQALNSSLNVYFCTGKTYMCHDLMVRSNHNIDLCGCTLLTNVDAPILVSPANNGVAVNRVRIANGTLKGTSTDNTKTNQKLIYMAAFYSLFENLKCYNCYNGIHLRQRTGGTGGTTVENVIRNFKADECYNIAIETEVKVTDGRLEGALIDCGESGAAHGIHIYESAGWLINNVHIYGKPNVAFEVRATAHTLINNVYIEGNYSAEGFRASVLRTLALNNFIIAAETDKSRMMRIYELAGSSTVGKRFASLSNIILDSKAEGISVDSIYGNNTVEIYACGLRINDVYGVIKQPSTTVIKEL